MPQTSMRRESQSVMLLFNDKNENHIHILTTSVTDKHKNSSGDEIANVNFFYNIAHVEASAYAH